MTEIQAVKREVGQKRWLHYYPEDLPELCLFRYKVPRGTRWTVYTPRAGDNMAGDTDDIVPLRTLTVIPPGGRVRVHCEKFEEPIEYIGSWKRVGAGIIFKASFDYEALEDTEWLCLAGYNPAIPGYSLNPLLLEAGSQFTATAKTKMLVCMKGQLFGKAWVLQPGETLTFDNKALVGVLEEDDV